MKQNKVIVCDFNEDEIEIEDGGQSKMFVAVEDGDLDNGLFVRVCSWDEDEQHTDFNKFVGRKVKITIETID
jgi:hypothetical protein